MNKEFGGMFHEESIKKQGFNSFAFGKSKTNVRTCNPNSTAFRKIGTWIYPLYLIPRLSKISYRIDVIEAHQKNCWICGTGGIYLNSKKGDAEFW